MRQLYVILAASALNVPGSYATPSIVVLAVIPSADVASLRVKSHHNHVKGSLQEEQQIRQTTRETFALNCADTFGQLTGHADFPHHQGVAPSA